MFRSSSLTSVVLGIAMCGAAATRLTAQEPGTLKGKVIFKGDPDKYKPRPIEIPKDAKCTPKQPLLTESVILNLDTRPVTLRNVIVSIKEGPVDKRYRWLQQPQLMITENCRFEPHVVALLEDLSLDVRNEDAVSHNVHFMAKKNRPHVFTIPRKGMQMSVSFEPEEPIEIKSNKYPWMGAWFTVFDHPYFVITNEPGTYLFDGVPPGKYVLEAWHETFGTKTLTVEVGDGETKEADFVYEPDKK